VNGHKHKDTKKLGGGVNHRTRRRRSLSSRRPRVKRKIWKMGAKLIKNLKRKGTKVLPDQAEYLRKKKESKKARAVDNV